MSNKKELAGKFREGIQVFYRDPDSFSSGVYTVKEQVTEDNDGLSIYLISNEFSESEVYEYELSEI